MLRRLVLTAAASVAASATLLGAVAPAASADASARADTGAFTESAGGTLTRLAPVPLPPAEDADEFTVTVADSGLRGADGTYRLKCRPAGGRISRRGPRATGWRSWRARRRIRSRRWRRARSARCCTAVTPPPASPAPGRGTLSTPRSTGRTGARSPAGRRWSRCCRAPGRRARAVRTYARGPAHARGATYPRSSGRTACRLVRAPAPARSEQAPGRAVHPTMRQLRGAASPVKGHWHRPFAHNPCESSRSSAVAAGSPAFRLPSVTGRNPRGKMGAAVRKVQWFREEASS